MGDGVEHLIRQARLQVRGRKAVAMLQPSKQSYVCCSCLVRRLRQLEVNRFSRRRIISTPQTVTARVSLPCPRCGTASLDTDGRVLRDGLRCRVLRRMHRPWNMPAPMFIQEVTRMSPRQPKTTRVRSLADGFVSGLWRIKATPPVPCREMPCGTGPSPTTSTERSPRGRPSWTTYDRRRGA